MARKMMALLIVLGILFSNSVMVFADNNPSPADSEIGIETSAEDENLEKNEVLMDEIDGGQKEENLDEDKKQIFSEENNGVEREPLIFKLTEGLTLHRGKDGVITASDFSCVNKTGLDVTLIGVEIALVGDWQLADEEVDFKNFPANLHVFRLRVNDQLIHHEGYTSLHNQVVFCDGDEIHIPISLEMGPFRKAITEGLFSFTLVFQEITKDEPIEPEISIEDNQIPGGAAPDLSYEITEDTDLVVDSSTDTATSEDLRVEKPTLEEVKTPEIFDTSEKVEIPQGEEVLEGVCIEDLEVPLSDNPSEEIMQPLDSTTQPAADGLPSVEKVDRVSIDYTLKGAWSYENEFHKEVRQ